jgi:hypothetical protein
MRKPRRCWYFITEDSCPICMRFHTYRERRYTRRPKAWFKRHEYTETWDGCEL